jgi:hypothetical protein
LVAAQEKALANKANKRRQAAAQEKVLVDEANKRRRAAVQENALAVEAKKRAAALAESVLSKEQHCHEAAKQAAMLAKKALAEERRRHKTATQEKALANEANKQRQAAAQRLPTSDPRPPHGTKRWPTRLLTCNVATSWPNALQLWRQMRLPRTSTTRTTTMLRGNLRRTPHPSLLALMPSWPKSKPWMTVSATGLHLVTRSLPRRTTKPQL